MFKVNTMWLSSYRYLCKISVYYSAVPARSRDSANTINKKEWEGSSNTVQRSTVTEYLENPVEPCQSIAK